MRTSSAIIGSTSLPHQTHLARTAFQVPEKNFPTCLDRVGGGLRRIGAIPQKALQSSQLVVRIAALLPTGNERESSSHLPVSVTTLTLVPELVTGAPNVAPILDPITVSVTGQAGPT